MALARWGALVVLACVVHACHAETNTTNATNTSAAPTTPAFVDAKICEEGGEGTFFPAIEDEYKWSRASFKKQRLCVGGSVLFGAGQAAAARAPTGAVCSCCPFH